MKALERILVVCDSSMQQSAALRRGLQLAKRSGAELQLCIFAFDDAIKLTASRVSPEVMALAKAQFIGERMAWLEEQARAAAEAGLRVECDAIWAPKFAEAVVSKALEIKPDLVLKDVQQQSAFKRALLLPRDWKLMRFCPAPLLLAFPGSENLPRKILVAVDPGEHSPEAAALNTAVVDAALRLGLYCDAVVDVATSFPYTASTSYVYPLLTKAIDEARSGHARSFTDFAKALNIPAERQHTLEGDPAYSLTEFALKSATDLLVLGTHFRSGWERLALGSTAESLVNQIHCDVLLIKPAGVLEEIRRHLHLAAPAAQPAES